MVRECRHVHNIIAVCAKFDCVVHFAIDITGFCEVSCTAQFHETLDFVPLNNATGCYDSRAHLSGGGHVSLILLCLEL